MSDTSVVTRFAPSPTGFMHVGNVRTALFAYLYAKRHGGTFILRIEDTDKEREVAGSIEHIIESLTWLGVTWDQGPTVGGPHAPYIQSQRLDIYRRYADMLIAKGLAYPDPYTTDELEAFRAQAETEKRAFLYRDHRPENPGMWDGTKPLRFKVPEVKSYAWHDEVFGDLSAGPEALDDFILIKSDGYPTYNFAHIVDDIEMGVTLVCRGQEFISSTPKFLSVYDALGITPPLFASLPHIMADGGNKKLGKRDGAKDILEYRREGFLPEAMVNFLAFLGWNPGDDREVMTMPELINAFDISRIQKSGAQFNDEKLLWLNREHVKRLTPSEQFTGIKHELPESIRALPGYSDATLEKIVPILLDHIHVFSDMAKLAEEGELTYYFEAPITYDMTALLWKSLREDADGRAKTKSALEAVLATLTAYTGTWDAVALKDAIWPLTETYGRGEMLWPLRYTLSGRDKSPDPFMLLSVLGKDESIRRITEIVHTL